MAQESAAEWIERNEALIRRGLRARGYGEETVNAVHLYESAPGGFKIRVDELDAPVAVAISRLLKEHGLMSDPAFHSHLPMSDLHTHGENPRKGND
jgi:hypothetical protein